RARAKPPLPSRNGRRAGLRLRHRVSAALRDPEPASRRIELIEHVPACTRPDLAESLQSVGRRRNLHPVAHSCQPPSVTCVPVRFRHPAIPRCGLPWPLTTSTQDPCPWGRGSEITVGGQPLAVWSAVRASCRNS